MRIYLVIHWCQTIDAAAAVGEPRDANCYHQAEGVYPRASGEINDCMSMTCHDFGPHRIIWDIRMSNVIPSTHFWTFAMIGFSGSEHGQSGLLKSFTPC